MKNIIIIASLSVFCILTVFYKHIFGTTLTIISGIVMLCLLLIYSVLIHKERNILEEENRYFIETFQNIRNPISLVKPSLEMVYNQCDSDSVKKELPVAIQSLTVLDNHLNDLMELKDIYMNPDHSVITEYELRSFITKKVDYFKTYTADREIILTCNFDINYISVWFDAYKVSKIIDRFILFAINITKPKEEIRLLVSLDKQFWYIRFQRSSDNRFLKQIKEKLDLFFYEEIKGRFQTSVLFKKLLDVCGGKLIINGNDIGLRFPVGCSDNDNSRGFQKEVVEDIVQVEIDDFFMKSHTKVNDKPSIIIADSDDKFCLYLKKYLSDNYVIKCFNNGLEAYESVLEEYPDLIICDALLSGMGGDELSSRLKTSTETSLIPILLLDSLIDSDKSQKRKYSMADVCLHKPFNLEELTIEISVLIHNSRMLRKSFLRKIFGEHFLETPSLDLEKEKNIQLLNKVREYILINLEDESLKIDHIAAHVCMGRTKFFYKWKSLTGEAPKYFILRIRMEKARELLESKKYLINEVPEKVGLKSVKNFRVMYKKYFGIVPKESMKQDGM